MFTVNSFVLSCNYYLFRVYDYQLERTLINDNRKPLIYLFLTDSFLILSSEIRIAKILLFSG